jgi:hypothetical protein
MSNVTTLARARYISGMGRIPAHMHSGMVRYVENGIPPGDFAMAALAHEWEEAAGRADMTNTAWLESGRWQEFMKYLPDAAHGSYEKVRAWCNGLGLNGMEKQEAESGA